MNDQTVNHNGVQMSVDWPERIAQAQKQTAYVINGKHYKRLAYGDEGDDWGANNRPCHDCAVVKGQLHVPGCDVERCPRCGGQAISCDCSYEEDETSSVSTARTAVQRFFERQFEKVEQDTFELLQKAWDVECARAFAEIGGAELTADQVRRHMLQVFDTHATSNSDVEKLWRQLSSDDRMALLEEAFSEPTYSRSKTEI